MQLPYAALCAFLLLAINPAIGGASESKDEGSGSRRLRAGRGRIPLQNTPSTTESRPSLLEGYEVHCPDAKDQVRGICGAMLVGCKKPPADHPQASYFTGDLLLPEYKIVDRYPPDLQRKYESKCNGGAFCPFCKRELTRAESDAIYVAQMEEERRKIAEKHGLIPAAAAAKQTGEDVSGTPTEPEPKKNKKTVQWDKNIQGGRSK